MSDTLEAVDCETHVELRQDGKIVGAVQFDEDAECYSVFVGGRAVDVRDCLTLRDALRVAKRAVKAKAPKADVKKGLGLVDALKGGRR